MVNYPYAADFLKPLPANPVDAVCEILLDCKYSVHEFAMAIAKAVSIYTNYTGTVVCNDLEGKDSKLGEQGWDFQVSKVLLSGIIFRFETHSFKTTIHLSFH